MKYIITIEPDCKRIGIKQEGGCVSVEMTPGELTHIAAAFEYGEYAMIERLCKEAMTV